MRLMNGNGKLHNLMLEHAGMDRLLQVTSEFLQNPMTVTGLDFTFVAEAGSEYLPPRARLYTDDGLNMEYVNALLQNETYRDMADTHEYVMFPAYISGCRSMNRNLFVDGKATHRLVLTECRSEITLRVICVLDILVEKLEYLLAHEAEEEDPDRDMEQIFVRILSDRTADYMQVSRELSELGWSGNHEYMCLILQITYLNQQNLSTKAICRYIKKKFEDSVSFLIRMKLWHFLTLQTWKKPGGSSRKTGLFYQGYLSESRIQQSDDRTYESETAVCAGERRLWM